MAKKKRPEENPQKIPPQNVDAEQAVLGSILLKQDSLLEVLGLLRPEDFYKDAHKIIYQAMLELFDKGEPVDFLSLSNYLREKGKLAQAGEIDYLVKLCDIVLASGGISYYGEIVKEAALRRRLIEKCYSVLEEAYQPERDTKTLLEMAEQEIFQIAEEAFSRDKEGFSALKEVITSSYKKIEQLSGKDRRLTGLSTGYKEFDELTSGLQPSDLIIIAGRPGTGKTALSLNIAYNSALKGYGPVAIFSLEMSKVQLGLRFLSMDSGVDSRMLRVGFLRDNEVNQVLQSLGRLAELPIFVDETSAITVFEMKAKCRRLKRSRGLGLIIVDYLQLVQGRKNVESRQMEISEISRGLKAMAKDLNVPVIAVSQLNRKVEDRPTKKPQLADLRESGAIEQDADLILFIYKEDNQKESNVMKVEIAKHRNGPMGAFKLIFAAPITRFYDLEIHPQAIAAG